MKKIALISDGWRRMITYAWVDGIIRRIRELDEDIALYQYNCYGNWSKDALHNTGEYNIYNLPDLSAFDGIILDGSNIVDVRQKEKIVERLQNCGVPVLSLDWYISGFYYVGADNRRPIRELMTHYTKCMDAADLFLPEARKMLSEILNVLLRTANA